MSENLFPGSKPKNLEKNGMEILLKVEGKLLKEFDEVGSIINFYV